MTSVQKRKIPLYSLVYAMSWGHGGEKLADAYVAAYQAANTKEREVLKDKVRRIAANLKPYGSYYNPFSEASHHKLHVKEPATIVWEADLISVKVDEEERQRALRIERVETCRAQGMNPMQIEFA